MGEPLVRVPWRLFAVTLAWIATFWVLAHFGARLVPLSLARVLTYETFLTLVQVVTLAVGLGLTFLLVERPRAELALLPAAPRQLTRLVLLTPAIYVVVSYVAVSIALPTLLDELRRGGAQLVRSQAGDFGRAMVAAPVWSTLLWAVAVSPIGEELLFRGALWSTAQRFAERLVRPPASHRLPPELLQDGAVVVAARRLWTWLRGGGFATLATTAVFALMHTGMSGGQGVLRVVAATGLGFACGSARQLTGSLLAPVLLHAIFNLLSLAAARRWLVTDALPNWFMVPTLASLLAAACLVGAVLVGWAWRPPAPRP